jgi:hypothetical protein
MHHRNYKERRKKLRKEAGSERMRTEKLLGYPELMEFVAMKKDNKI